MYLRNNLIAWGSAAALLLGTLFLPSNGARLAWLVLAGPLAYLIWMTYRQVHPTRLLSIGGFTPAAVNLPYEKVVVKSRDGLLLSGWFIAGWRQRGIIMVHGLAGSMSSVIHQAAALAKSGYCVLLLDLRAHGSSQGNTSTFGISEANDILGAVDYLQTRSELDPQRIGALGISLGAQAVLRGAIDAPQIQALVLEGLATTSLEDHGGKPTSLQRKINYPINWLVYRLGDWMAGLRAPESTTSVLSKFGRPVLLIACGRGKEIYFNRLFYAAAKDPKYLWEIPKTRHAAGFYQDMDGYRKKVVGFFDAALATPKNFPIEFDQ